MDRILVVIPAFRRVDSLESIIKSVFLEREVLVSILVSVDHNISLRSSYKKLTKKYKSEKRIRFVFHEKQLGAERNASFCLSPGLLKESEFDFLFFCEDDIVPVTGLLNILATVNKKDNNDSICVSAAGIIGRGEFCFYRSPLVPAWGMLFSAIQLEKFDISPISLSEKRAFSRSLRFNFKLLITSPLHFLLWYRSYRQDKQLSYGDISVFYRNIFHGKAALIPTYTLIKNKGFDSSANQMLSKYREFFKGIEIKDWDRVGAIVKKRRWWDVLYFTLRRWLY